MKLLAWDTSTKTGAIWALEWDHANPNAKPEIRSAWTLSVAASDHSEQLLWAIDRILESCRWKLADLNALAVGVGPGSFTGLRIGVTTARTLAQALGLKISPFSSLAALARLHASSLPPDTRVYAAMDACKGEVFLLEGPARAIARCVLPEIKGWPSSARERVLSFDALAKRLRSARARYGARMKWHGIGDAFVRNSEIWHPLPRAAGDWNIALSGRISGEIVAQVGFESWKQTSGGLNPSLIFPAYLRDADATIKLRKGLLKVAPVSSD
ncbi:MAG: tRNA (adenosine(37)-N6)-threonylcarbamoyltransferase complex dimerization subunit type 1 TsaB [Bdellovibrionota bacterium]